MTPRLCKGSNCKELADLGKKYCFTCYGKWRNRQAYTALLPKCACQSVLSVARQSMGCYECPSCERDQPVRFQLAQQWARSHGEM